MQSNIRMRFDMQGSLTLDCLTMCKYLPRVLLSCIHNAQAL